MGDQLDLSEKHFPHPQVKRETESLSEFMGDFALGDESEDQRAPSSVIKPLVDIWREYRFDPAFVAAFGKADPRLIFRCV
jgi:hypothetical protein